MRDALVEDSEGSVYEEAIDTLTATTTARSIASSCSTSRSTARSSSLDDRFSNYFAPKDYTDFQQATEGRFEGVGMTVEPVAKRACA